MWKITQEVPGFSGSLCLKTHQTDPRTAQTAFTCPESNRENLTVLLMSDVEKKLMKNRSQAQILKCECSSSAAVRSGKRCDEPDLRGAVFRGGTSQAPSRQPAVKTRAAERNRLWLNVNVGSRDSASCFSPCQGREGGVDQREIRGEDVCPGQRRS